MRLHIENQANRIEELERVKEKNDMKFESEVKEIKHEKRRLNELLTLRENEIDQLKKKDRDYDEKVNQFAELEKKLKK